MDKKTLKEAIGENVRELRKGSGVASAEELAELMNEHLPENSKTSKQAVLRFERGDKSITLIEAFALSRVLSVPLERIFDPEYSDLQSVSIKSDEQGMTLQIANKIEGDAPQEIVAQFENAVLLCKVERVITI